MCLVIIIALNESEMIRSDFCFFQGVQPSCKNVDGYCIFCDSLNHSKCFGPYENRMFITLDERPHRITVTAFRNETSLNEASVEVPGTAEGEIV